MISICSKIMQTWVKKEFFFEVLVYTKSPRISRSFSFLLGVCLVHIEKLQILFSIKTSGLVNLASKRMWKAFSWKVAVFTWLWFFSCFGQFNSSTDCPFNFNRFFIRFYISYYYSARCKLLILLCRPEDVWPLRNPTFNYWLHHIRKEEPGSCRIKHPLLLVPIFAWRQFWEVCYIAVA